MKCGTPRLTRQMVLKAPGVTTNQQLLGKGATALREDPLVCISRSLRVPGGRFFSLTAGRWLRLASAPARAPDALCAAREPDASELPLPTLHPSAAVTTSLKKQLPTDPRSQEDSCWVVISFTLFPFKPPLSCLLPPWISCCNL